MPAVTSGDATPVGYSGKPVAKKLGLKPGLAAAVFGAPSHYGALVNGAPIERLESVPVGRSFGFLHLFVRTAEELARHLPKLEPALAEGGMLWVSWPKKSSPLHRDLVEDGVRAVALPMGLVDIKVCAVDEDWSALKLVRRKACA